RPPGRWSRWTAGWSRRFCGKFDQGGTRCPQRVGLEKISSNRIEGNALHLHTPTKLMKLGAHIYLWMERWSDAEVGLLERARGLGLEAIELSVGLNVKFSPALTRRTAEANGIMLLVGPGGAWPDGADLSDDDPANRRAALEFHQSIVDQTAELGGVAYAGALYGRPGKVLKRRPPADEFPRTAEGLHTLAEYARKAGVKIILEPMSRFRSHVVNTPGQMLKLVNAADHANLHTLLVTYHLVTEVRDYAAAIRSVGDRIWGLH